MAKSETVSAPETVSSPVGFTPTNAKRMADDCRALVAMLQAANALKGTEKARSVTRVRHAAAATLGDFIRDASMASAARGSRIGVQVKGTHRGSETIENESHPVFNIVEAIALGGTISGSKRLA